MAAFMDIRKTKADLYEELTQRLIDCDDRYLALIDTAIFWANSTDTELVDDIVWHAMLKIITHYDLKASELNEAAQLMRARR